MQATKGMLRMGEITFSREGLEGGQGKETCSCFITSKIISKYKVSHNKKIQIIFKLKILPLVHFFGKNPIVSGLRITCFLFL